jgi:hypothetical protein
MKAGFLINCAHCRKEFDGLGIVFVVSFEQKMAHDADAGASVMGAPPEPQH